MLSIGWGEMVVIGLIALVVVGPDRWPEMARTLGQFYGKFRRVVTEAQQNIVAEADLFSTLTKPELSKINPDTLSENEMASTKPEFLEEEPDILAGADMVSTPTKLTPNGPSPPTQDKISKS